MFVDRLLPAALVACLMSGCVLGSESQPGCRPDHPDDCAAGWTCRAGVCMRTTTPTSPPTDAGDGDAFVDAPETTPDVRDAPFND